LAQVGADPETGKIDIERITKGITASQRSKISVIKEIITDLEAKFGKTIMITDIVDAASGKGVAESDVEETIEKLKRSGDIFEPKSGFISRL
jgi:replicative DNA helicase Mcm